MTILPGKHIVNEFQMRRKKTLYQAALPGLTGFVVSFLTIAFSGKQLDETSAIIVLLGFLVFAGGIINATRLYRCPSCENVVLNRSGGHSHMPIDPEHCPRCGAVLKDHKHIEMNL
jgi:phage FluMu protein Com